MKHALTILAVLSLAPLAALCAADTVGGNPSSHSSSTSHHIDRFTAMFIASAPVPQ